MNLPSIISIGTRVPENRYRQEELYDRFIEPHLGGNPRARAIFTGAGIGFRHTVVDGSYYGQERTTEARNDLYFEKALPLAQDAILDALLTAGIGPEAIDEFIIVSCTGIDTPGLDLRLAGALGMRSDLRRASILGMGCYAAFPGLERARQAVIAQPGRTALILDIELCSLHFQQDASTENVVSSALFADGAAAVVVSSAPSLLRESACPFVLETRTYCNYQTLDHMAFHVTDHGFQMRLSAYVPEVLAANVSSLVDRLIKPHNLALPDIRHWVVHPGSRKILDHIQAQLGLSDSQLDSSRQILFQYGNMSSATVFFVLDDLQRHSLPKRGEYGVMMAFGPGLTMESALIQW